MEIVKVVRQSMDCRGRWYWALVVCGEITADGTTATRKGAEVRVQEAEDLLLNTVYSCAEPYPEDDAR